MSARKLPFGAKPGDYPVLEGLEEGDRVVTSRQLPHRFPKPVDLVELARCMAGRWSLRRKNRKQKLKPQIAQISQIKTE